MTDASSAVRPAHSLRAAIRDATHRRHVELEQRLNVEAGAWTLARYASFLRATLAVVTPLEPRIDALLPPALWRRAAQPSATERLRRDLAAVGVDAAPEPGDVPSVPTVASAFGAAYVLEGSRLGGQIVADRLCKRLPIAEQHVTYLRSTGDPVGPRWHAFLSSLEAYGLRAGAGDWDAAAATAAATFVSFANSFSKEGVIDAERPGRPHQL